ncbi:hypothetical protein KP509_31G011100 [Ceratopteris richardii]|nr:hypothetical protein KP509_31G011100 [Ceratopteris richardii]KAH7288077.1 hypothetical protein KP509_31G011100 [Ceratopteris richardii]KAH7288082.1 hypothetical protein KP509_31G011100 [Ceratopteris richardii]KAH7288083.1 hypothetical protein KP509_31G011100 [Ceratopteris richardii]KAH7288084.1 hypothetical protein KP509_31G011100 [Ceratopteris richardii]
MGQKQELVESTFLSSITSRSHAEAHVNNTDRICRLTVTIEALKHIKRANKSMKDLVLKVTAEGKSRKFSQMNVKADELGGIIINRSFAFEITDIKRSTLLVQVYTSGIFGNKILGQSKSILVSDLLKTEEECEISLRSEWYDVFSKDERKQLPCKILMQISVGVPQPEQNVHLFVGTWNVGNAHPADNLHDWFSTTSAYDLIAIGSQECEYSPRPPHTDCAKDWVATIKSAIGSDYKLVHGLSRGQMQLVLFVHKDSQNAISEVLNGSEATGIGHVVSNKGGICISLKFWDTSLCFLNCHFAAHEGQCEARNENYREIVGNLRMLSTNTDILNQFHHVFWLGDLNYRLREERTNDKQSFSNTASWDAITNKICHKEFNELLMMDELHREKEAQNVFYLFSEGEITFPPTFKMKRNTEDVYDQKRLPAWCDRVLWFSLPGFNVRQLSYTSIPSISSSDHKPVAATFALTALALPCDSKGDPNNDDMRWHVRFTALQAKNLRASDYSGSSDPYVEFFGQNIFQEVKSKVKFQDLNPTWNPLQDIPEIVLNTSSYERLKKDFIFVRIADFDYTSRDDTLGYGVIPLEGAAIAMADGGTCDFDAKISYRGCPAGNLTGTMQITWQRNVTKRKLQITKSFSIKTQILWHQLKRHITSKHIFSDKTS